MPNVRIQASVQSGRAILRFRNGLEQPVTVTPFVGGEDDKQDAWLTEAYGPGKARNPAGRPGFSLTLNVPEP